MSTLPPLSSPPSSSPALDPTPPPPPPPFPTRKESIQTALSAFQRIKTSRLGVIFLKGGLAVGQVTTLLVLLILARSGKTGSATIGASTGECDSLALERWMVASIVRLSVCWGVSLYIIWRKEVLKRREGESLVEEVVVVGGEESIEEEGNRNPNDEDERSRSTKNSGKETLSNFKDSAQTSSYSQFRLSSNLLSHHANTSSSIPQFHPDPISYTPIIPTNTQPTTEKYLQKRSSRSRMDSARGGLETDNENKEEEEVDEVLSEGSKVWKSIGEKEQLEPERVFDSDVGSRQEEDRGRRDSKDQNLSGIELTGETRSPGSEMVLVEEDDSRRTTLRNRGRVEPQREDENLEEGNSKGRFIKFWKGMDWLAPKLSSLLFLLSLGLFFSGNYLLFSTSSTCRVPSNTSSSSNTIPSDGNQIGNESSTGAEMMRGDLLWWGVATVVGVGWVLLAEVLIIVIGVGILGPGVLTLLRKVNVLPPLPTPALPFPLPPAPLGPKDIEKIRVVRFGSALGLGSNSDLEVKKRLEVIDGGNGDEHYKEKDLDKDKMSFQEKEPERRNTESGLESGRSFWRFLRRSAGNNNSRHGPHTTNASAHILPRARSSTYMPRSRSDISVFSKNTTDNGNGDDPEEYLPSLSKHDTNRLNPKSTVTTTLTSTRCNKLHHSSNMGNKDMRMSRSGDDRKNSAIQLDGTSNGNYPIVRLPTNLASCTICLVDFVASKADAKSMTKEMHTAHGASEREGDGGVEDDGEGEGDLLRMLDCGHAFHKDCIDPWLGNVSGRCPVCAKAVVLG